MLELEPESGESKPTGVDFDLDFESRRFLLIPEPIQQPPHLPMGGPGRKEEESSKYIYNQRMETT